MALDTRQRRMAALNPACPWRGPLVDASEAGFGKAARAAASFYYSDGEEEIIVVQTPPSGPTGRVDGNGDGRKKPLPPPRRRRRKRREAPPPERLPLTPAEIAAQDRERLARVVRRFIEGGGQPDAEAGREMLGLPDPNAEAIMPRIDWDAVANDLVTEQQRLRDEEEAEILLMAM